MTGPASTDADEQPQPGVFARAHELPRAIGDLLFLTATLIVGNLLVSSQDPGWLATNPNPYLLIPLLLGIRYGLLEGLVSALLTGGVVVLMSRADADPLPIPALLAANAYLFLFFPVIGAICGELRELAVRRQSTLTADNRELRDRHEALVNQLDILREANHQIRWRLALYGSETASLDTELRQLAAPHATPLPQGVLQMLATNEGVTDAAVYRLSSDGELELTAFIGDPDAFPDPLPGPPESMVGLALGRRDLVTCRGLWEQIPQFDEPYLAAIPWAIPNHDPQGVLVIHSMAFEAVSWQTFERIKLVCDWAARLTSPTTTDPETALLAGQTPTGKVFEEVLDQAWQALLQHRVPSAAAILTSRNGSAPEEFAASVAELLDATDVILPRATEPPALSLLLPLRGSRTTERQLAEISRQLHASRQLDGGFDYEVLPIDGTISHDDLKARLLHATADGTPAE